MNKFLVAGALALTLSACNTLSSLSGFSVTQSELDTLRSSYDAAFLTPAAHYRQLGYCAAGTAATLAKPCASRALVAQLQADDQIVSAAFGNVQAMIASGDNTGLTGAYSALQTAISTAEALALTNGVK